MVYGHKESATRYEIFVGNQPGVWNIFITLKRGYETKFICSNLCQYKYLTVLTQFFVLEQNAFCANLTMCVYIPGVPKKLYTI